MPNPAPKTQKWKAWQNLQPPGPPRLIVTGQVEISNTNQTPQLREHVPQGINPKILLLDLTITSSGVGNDVITWREVRFEKQIIKDQHSSIDVLWDGQNIGRANVETVQ
ncbi:MAG: hypothetical protein WAU53_12555 [Rhodoplanes sp.]